MVVKLEDEFDVKQGQATRVDLKESMAINDSFSSSSGGKKLKEQGDGDMLFSDRRQNLIYKQNIIPDFDAGEVPINMK